MNKFSNIAAAIMALCLISCVTNKKAATTHSSSVVEYIDTTKDRADTTDIKATFVDTTKTEVIGVSGGVIEFVEGGGKVSIDTAGNVTIEGVRNIKGRHKENIKHDKGISGKTEATAGHREQLNGVRAGQSKQVRQTEEKAPVGKWYDTMFARIGLGVCIAALMWLLFLYLKRKF